MYYMIKYLYILLNCISIKIINTFPFCYVFSVQFHCNILNFCFERDRKDCNSAYKKWLRSKNEAARKAKDNDRLLRRQSLKEARQARKAQKLLQAIREAQQMKYVEYYGYRF